MWIWLIVLLAYVIARKKGLQISEWLEILLAGLCLFLLFHMEKVEVDF